MPGVHLAPHCGVIPEGPFLAYDRQGNLVSSVYMIPLKAISAQKQFADLAAAKAQVASRGHVLHRPPRRGGGAPGAGGGAAAFPRGDAIVALGTVSRR
jgi:hypothetical protein